MAASDPKAFHGLEAQVKVGDAIDSIGTSDTLNAQMTKDTEYSATVTDLTLTDPEASVDIQNAFGQQVKTESPFGLVEVDFTMRFKDLEMFTELHGDSNTSITASSTSTFERISGGATIGARPNKAILFRLSKTVDGTDYIIHYLLNNAWFQQMGEVSLSGDGVAELSGTAVCLVEDRYTEQNFGTLG